MPKMPGTCKECPIGSPHIIPTYAVAEVLSCVATSNNVNICLNATHAESQSIGCILGVKTGYTTNERPLQVNILSRLLCFSSVGGDRAICLIETAHLHFYGDAKAIILFYLCLEMLQTVVASFCSAPS